MREICRDLQGQGYGSAILKELQSINLEGTARDAHISFIVFTEHGKPAYDLARYPRIAFAANSDTHMICVREKLEPSSGGQGRSAGEYTINAVTQPLVEKHIRDFLSEVYGPDH